MSADRIHKSVGKFQEPNTSWAKRHERDLRYAGLMLRNSMIDALRKGHGITFDLSVVNKVLELSDVIEETTLTREKIGGLETHYKEGLVQKYFHEGSEYNNNYRLPNKTNNFKAFGRKTDFVKDAAMTMVIEMYEIDQGYRKELLEKVRGEKSIEKDST